MSTGVTTADFDRYQPLDEQMDLHERLRLLYVARTRARDHLVVSVHRKRAEGDPKTSTKWSHAELLWDAGHDVPHWYRFRPWPRRPRSRRGAAGACRLLAERVARATTPACSPGARGRRHRDRDRGRRGAAAAPIPGLAKDARDLDLPPWQKGRYGTAIGRAVTPCSRRSTSPPATGWRHRRRPGRRRGRPRAGRPRSPRWPARRSPRARWRGRCPRLRRECTSAPAGEGVLEGFVDLLYRADDGLVVVDYKTDAWRDEADLDAKVDRYRLQGAAYALALEAASGWPVARCVFLFRGADGAVERDVADLPRCAAV